MTGLLKMSRLVVTTLVFDVVVGNSFLAEDACADDHTAAGESTFDGDASSQVGGEGLQADAMAWLRKAAVQGHADDQYFLGGMYRFAIGVPEDYTSAYAWFNLSAARGNGKAEEARATIRKLMTPAQIAEGQKLSRELLEAQETAARTAKDDR